MRLHRLAPGLVLTLVITGCGTPADYGSPPRIGFVVKRTQSSCAKELISGFRAGAGLVGELGVTAQGPPGQDGNKEVELFNQLTSTAKGGIAVAASDPALIAPSLATAASNDVQVVSVDSRPAPGSRVKLHIGNDNYELGAMLADELLRHVPPESTGKIILGNTSPGLSGLDQRAKGIRDELTRKRPGVHVMGPFDTQRDPSANLDAWQRLVAANPDALAFLGTGDTDASHLAAIRRQATGPWVVAGFGVDPEVVQAVKDRVLVATVSPEHYLKGALAGWVLAQHATGRGSPPEGWIYTPGLAITSANVDEILRRQESEASRAAWYQAQIDAYIADTGQFTRSFDQAR